MPLLQAVAAVRARPARRTRLRALRRERGFQLAHATCWLLRSGRERDAQGPVPGALAWKRAQVQGATRVSERTRTAGRAADVSAERRARRTRTHVRHPQRSALRRSATPANAALKGTRAAAGGRVFEQFASSL
jgi:hypothetical protein